MKLTFFTSLLNPKSAISLVSLFFLLKKVTTLLVYDYKLARQRIWRMAFCSMLFIIVAISLWISIMTILFFGLESVLDNPCISLSLLILLQGLLLLLIRRYLQVQAQGLQFSSLKKHFFNTKTIAK